jgi:small subunit ribosomal protein S20
LANTRSARKEIRADCRKQARNRIVRVKTRTLVTRARKSIEKTPGQADKDVTVAVSGLDKAAGKGVIHPNNAARRKSRLMRRLNKTQAG